MRTSCSLDLELERRANSRQSHTGCRGPASSSGPTSIFSLSSTDNFTVRSMPSPFSVTVRLLVSLRLVLQRAWADAGPALAAVPHHRNYGLSLIHT